MPELNDLLREFTGQTAINVLFLIAGAILVAINRTVNRTARRVFFTSLLVLACIALADWATYIMSGTNPQLRWLHTLLMALTFALAPFIPVAIADTVFPGTRTSWVHVILVAQAIVELATIFGGFVFFVDANNVYHRGQFYVAYMATYTMSAIYLSVKSIRAGSTYQSANMGGILAILACMGTGVAIQVFNPNIRTTWPAVSMAVVLYFLFYTDMVLRTDVLTKLLNRHSYDEFLHNPPLPCIVVVIDIDNFKYINDTYGHAYGDECIATTGSLIRKAFGGCGLCYRTGGDEFTVVITKKLDSVEDQSNALVELISQARLKDNRLPEVSIGYARANDDCANILTIVQEADKNMYASKRGRKKLRRG